VVRGGFHSKVIELGSARCAEIHQRLTYTSPLGGIITDLKINQTTFYSNTIAVSIDMEGNCKGTTYKSDKGEWQNVVVPSKVQIQLSEGTAIANSKDIVFILTNWNKTKIIRSLWF